MRLMTKCTLLAGILSCAASVAPAGAGTSKSSQGTAAKAGPGTLERYYQDMQAQYLSKGLMKTVRHVPGAPMDAASLAQDFLEIALINEHGQGLSGGRSAKPLLRWEDPVRLQVHFGASVPKAKRAADLRTVSKYVNTLARATRHPITVNPHRPNFHVLVVSEGERKSLARTLPKLIPGLSKATVKTIARMRKTHLCMVVAEPHADRRRGFKTAVAIVRAEHPDAMRASCLHEELAQGLGLSNDCEDVWPSIFNDDQEFALLTRRDEKLLGMLYDRRLASGMTADQVKPYLHAVASAQF